MQTAVVISDLFTGLTNVLFAMSQCVYLSNKMNLPFEFVGFLDIGCDVFWKNCNNNSIIPVSDLFDFQRVSKMLNVSMKEVDNNYCYVAQLPSKSDFNFSTFNIEGRTKVVGMLWNYFDTRNEALSWLVFVNALQHSLNEDIQHHCNRIVHYMAGPFQCIYPRNDGDYQAAETDNLLAYAQHNKTYVATREPRTIYHNMANTATKFTFGNYSSNFRSLLVDSCVCSHAHAYDFHGSGSSTFTMLIVAMRHNNGLRRHTIHGNNFESAEWYPIYMDIPEVKYLSN